MNATTDLTYAIGQSLGIISAVCAVLRPMCRDKRRILLLNIAVNGLVATNYILIGRIGSAAALGMVAVIQSLVSLTHERRGTAVSTGQMLVFAGLYIGFGLAGIVSAPEFVWAINRRNLLELMPIAAAMLLMASLFAPNAQTARKFLLCNGLLWTAYALAAGSSTFLTNLLSALSAGAALWRYRNTGR